MAVVGQFLGPMAVFMSPKFAAVVVIVPGFARPVFMLVRMGMRVFVGMGVLMLVRVPYIPVRVLVSMDMLVFVFMPMFVFMGVLHACPPYQASL